MIQGAPVNYHESTQIRYSVKVKIDLAYSRLHWALAAQKPAESCTGSNVLGSNWRLLSNCDIFPTFERSEWTESTVPETSVKLWARML